MAGKENKLTTFQNQLLIATPALKDPRFDRALVFICGHDKKGAMGIVVNKWVSGLLLSDMLGQMNIPHEDPGYNPPVHFGGPVEIGRGFVVHTTDYLHESSTKVSADIALTATVDVLHVIGSKKRPEKSLLALGYSGWGSGQLEGEIQHNSWLQIQAEQDLVFSENVDGSWQKAIKKLGFDPGMLSEEAGHA